MQLHNMKKDQDFLDLKPTNIARRRKLRMLSVPVILDGSLNLVSINDAGPILMDATSYWGAVLEINFDSRTTSIRLPSVVMELQYFIP